MMEWVVLLLPFAAASGWYTAQASLTKKKRFDLNFPKDYFIGLNFLLNEEPDKAVDVFIKLLEVDSETVETHLALGNLFRRRGEVARAIRIHQNLIARPTLDKKSRTQALLALGQDYLRAGVFDRAERLFLEVIATGDHVTTSLKYLIDIYQQEKNWESAISMAEKYEKFTNEKLSTSISNYYCELALQARIKNDVDATRRYLKNALASDRQCVRASLMQADLEVATGQYKSAIRAYQQVKHQDPDYLSEIITPLIMCYTQRDSENELIEYLWECLEDSPRISVVLVLTDYLYKTQGVYVAADFMAEQLRRNPSLRGLERLIELHLLNAEAKAKENLLVLHDLITDLLKAKPIYRCHHCGFNGRVLHWQCPGCKNWNTVKPIHGLEGD